MRRARTRLVAGLLLAAALHGEVVTELDVAYDTRSPKQKLDLYYDDGAGQGLRPAIVLVHGGGWSSGDKGGKLWRTLPVEFAQRGYVAASVNYRLTDEAPTPAQIEDVKAAVRWLRANAERLRLDPDRIGAFGHSAGAHLVALLGLTRPKDGLEGDGPNQEQSSAVQAVLAWAAPTDFARWLESGQYPREAVEAFLAGPDET
ncbi:MAG: alpha/beta hydrolase, partial [Acidobacteria bacterium]|nr:alpha/beta hydrolase [Acidobacteriota bacterium]